MHSSCNRHIVNSFGVHCRSPQMRSSASRRNIPSIQGHRFELSPVDPSAILHRQVDRPLMIRKMVCDSVRRRRNSDRVERPPSLFQESDGRPHSVLDEGHPYVSRYTTAPVLPHRKQHLHWGGNKLSQRLVPQVRTPNLKPLMPFAMQTRSAAPHTLEYPSKVASAM